MMDELNDYNFASKSLAVRSFLMEHLNVPDGTALSECRYHYTTADVLEKFLVDDGDLLCTHCRSLNDGGEFVIGIRHLIDYMKDRNWNQALVARVSNQMHGFAQYDLSMPWIFSFSLYNDSAFQWANYTDRKNGGYAIGFSVSSLLDLVSQRVDKANKNVRYPISTFFLPCIYVGVDDAFSEFDFFFKKHLNYDAVYSAQVDEGVVDKIISMALILASFVKDKSFYFEGECRLVVSANFDEAYKRVNSVGGRARMPARVKDDIGLLRDVMKSVIISPHGRRDSLYVNALNLKRKFNADFNIVFSASSYRG